MCLATRRGSAPRKRNFTRWPPHRNNPKRLPPPHHKHKPVSLTRNLKPRPPGGAQFFVLLKTQKTLIYVRRNIITEKNDISFNLPITKSPVPLRWRNRPLLLKIRKLKLERKDLYRLEDIAIYFLYKPGVQRLKPFRHMKLNKIEKELKS